MSRVLSTGLLLSVCSLGCGGGGVVQVDPNRLEFIEDYVDGTLLPTLDTSAVSMGALEVATAAYASDPTPATLETAQAAWRDAARDWQRAELMTVGPAGAMGIVIGGEDRRDGIYSWPVVNPCRVDQETLEEAHASETLLAAELVNVRGLDAVEYLLFDDDTENACTAVSAINAEGQWAAAQEMIAARRARYAATASALLADEVTALVARWREGFREKLIAPPNDVYPSNQEALNSVVDALFYLDGEVKDMKLGVPAGLSLDCTTPTCPDARESRFANVSLRLIEANLEGFAAVYRGAEGRIGLEELLVLAGATDLATRMGAAVDNALSVAASMTGSIPEVLTENPLGLMPLYDAIKAITDLMKTELLSVLDLELPDRADGDND